jgi:hypothetical protein
VLIQRYSPTSESEKHYIRNCYLFSGCTRSMKNIKKAIKTRDYCIVNNIQSLLEKNKSVFKLTSKSLALEYKNYLAEKVSN